MKSFMALVLVYASLAIAISAQAETSDITPPMKAITVDYFGGYTGYDKGGYQLLRSAIGQMVADETLSIFITEAIGKSGGGSFCLELSPKTEKTVQDVIKVLRSIKPADQVTVYRYKVKTECISETSSTKETQE